MSFRRAPEAGFALLSAIFVLVVLSALGAYLASIASVQHATPMQRTLGVQAWFAARAGVEWAIGDVAASGGASLGCGGTPVILSLGEGAAAGFEVSVACTATAVTEGSSAYTLFELDATATRGVLGDPAYVSRRLVATVAE